MSAAKQDEQYDIVGAFNRAASDYDSHGPQIFSEFGRRLVDLSGVTPGARVLDVATGRGAVLFPLADRIGPQGTVVGIDAADKMLHETSSDPAHVGRTNIELVQMHAERLEFPGASFDFVFCGFALWLFPHPHAALKEFYRVLRPGGCLALTMWAKDSPFLEWVRQEIGASLKPGIAKSKVKTDSPTLGSSDFGTLEKIQTALQHAGFTDIQSHGEEHDFVYSCDQEWWASLWGHGLRSRFETLDAMELESFRSDLIRKVQTLKQPDGIHTIWRPLFARSLKPC